MDIGPSMIKHVASVSRIILTEKEVEEFLPQMSEILEKFSKLSEVDTDAIAPSFHPIPLKDEMREDTIRPSLEIDESLKNSLHKKGDYFKGPKVV